MTGFPFTRRSLLKATATLGAAATLRPAVGLSADATTVRMRLEHDVNSSDPARIFAWPAYYASSNMFNRLIEWTAGEAWQWELGVAQSIEQVDPTHIRFTLRPGILWTNGYGEMTAEDVKYSIERTLRPELESTSAPTWANLDQVEVVDKYTGVIALKKPDATIWTTNLPLLPATIVCREATEAVGGTFDVEPPATSGPYKLKEWVPQQKLVFERNELWIGSRPDFDEVVYHIIESEKTAELAYLAGELDFTNIAVSSVPSFLDDPPANSKVEVRPTLDFQWLGMNVDHPPFDDIRVRKAVRYAVDVRQIIDAAFFGVGSLSTGFLAPGVIGHREAEVPYPDYAKSRELLAAAGLAEGFATTITVMNRPDYVTAAQVIQANLAEIGIVAEVIPYESGMFWDLGLERLGESWKDLQLILNVYGMRPEPNEATYWFTPEQVGEWNWERWNNPEFGALNEQGIAESDPKKRDAIYKRMMNLMWESAAFVPITHPPAAVIYRDFIDPRLLPDASFYAWRFQSVG